MTFKEIADAVAALGTLGFALLAVYAFLTEKVVPQGRLEEQRNDKREAIELANRALAASERLSDAVEARNRLEETREQVRRESGQKS